MTVSSPINGVYDQDSVLPDAPPPNYNLEEPSESLVQPSHANGDSKADVKLEDLFKDDDSQDDEFSSSSVPDAQLESSPPAQAVYTCFFRK